jgi:hypothetical protein
MGRILKIPRGKEIANHSNPFPKSDNSILSSDSIGCYANRVGISSRKEKVGRRTRTESGGAFGGSGGLAREVPKDIDEWNRLKSLFLKKNPFEEPFFARDTLRMISIAPKRIGYANGLSEAFIETL